MSRRPALALLPLMILAPAAIVSAEALWTCPNDDPATPELEVKTVDCDAHTVPGSPPFDVPAVSCQVPPPPSDFEATFRFNCCCSGLLSAGALPATINRRVGGSSAMERDFVLEILPGLTDPTPDVIEAIDAVGLLSGATRTKETHRVFFLATLLPRSFGDSALAGDAAIAVQIRNERGLNRLGVASIEAPVDSQGVAASALNGFAQTYLAKDGTPLAFVELGSLDASSGTAVYTRGPDRDPTKEYLHVVEQVRSLNGDGSVRSDTFGVTAELMLRVYTLPRPGAP